ncbi:MAG: NADH-quinone oxidoreductase subunit J, partial [Anaerolineaceae bacterium]|nr:NADH-quinone oxidoreductase subunit J [Anaerolineaceae bacterium]
TRNPVFSVLFLVLNFAAVAVLYLVLGAPFIAFAQITVYAGAIMVLFLFVVMLLGTEHMKFDEPLKGQRWIAGILALVFLVLVSLVLLGRQQLSIDLLTPSIDFGSPGDVGFMLIDQYALPVLIISLVLLVAAIGAVVLTKVNQPATPDGQENLTGRPGLEESN